MQLFRRAELFHFNFQSCRFKIERQIFAPTWMDLEGIMSGEISRLRKTNTIRSHSYVKSKNKKQKTSEQTKTT